MLRGTERTKIIFSIDMSKYNLLLLMNNMKVGVK
jgi:hypothetical protein